LAVLSYGFKYYIEYIVNARHTIVATSICAVQGAVPNYHDKHLFCLLLLIIVIFAFYRNGTISLLVESLRISI